MKTTTTFLVMLLFAVMTCATASADTLIAGFETDLDGFSANDPNTVALGTTGVTEGSQALQFTADGGFDFLLSSFPVLLTDPLNDTIKFDVTFNPDDLTTVGFAQVNFGINSDGTVDPDNGFQFGPSENVSIDGSTTAVELNFSDLAEFPLDGTQTFVELLLIVNTNDEATGVWSFDNIRLHTVAVPEPSALVLICGLGMLGLLRRKK